MDITCNKCGLAVLTVEYENGCWIHVCVNCGNKQLIRSKPISELKRKTIDKYGTKEDI